MTKKMKIIISVIVLIVVMIGGCFAYKNLFKQDQTQNSEQTAKQKFKQLYPGLADDHRFSEVSEAEILRIFDNGDGLVFLGFTECPWCQALAPIVDQAAKQEGLEKINYLNIKEARTNNSEVYQKLVAKLEPYLNKDEDGNPRIYVPDVSVVSGGQIISHMLQETAPDGEKLTPEQYWTEERRQKALNQLREMIKQIKPKTVAEELENGAMLVDVRTEEEFEAAHIEQAINFPLDKIQAGEFPTDDKARKIFVYCRSGNRSGTAMQILKNQGYQQVVNLGGLNDVEKLGLPVIR